MNKASFLISWLFGFSLGIILLYGQNKLEVKGGSKLEGNLTITDDTQIENGKLILGTPTFSNASKLQVYGSTRMRGRLDLISDEFTTLL